MLQMARTIIENDELLKTFTLYTKRKAAITSIQATGNAADRIGFDLHPTFARSQDYEALEDPHPVFLSLKPLHVKEEATAHALRNAAHGYLELGTDSYRSHVELVEPDVAQLERSLCDKTGELRFHGNGRPQDVLFAPQVVAV